MSESAKKTTWKLVDWLSWLALVAAVLDAALKWLVDYQVPVPAVVLAILGVVVRIIRTVFGGGVGSFSVAALLAALGLGGAGIAGGVVDPPSRQPAAGDVYSTSGDRVPTNDVVEVLVVDLDVEEPPAAAVPPGAAAEVLP